VTFLIRLGVTLVVATMLASSCQASTSAPQAQPDRGPAATIDSDAVAAEPDPEVAQPPATEPDEQPSPRVEPAPGDSVNWEYLLDIDRGLMIDGAFTNVQHPGALQVRWRVDADPAERYFYSARDVTAQPGSELCLEQLQSQDERFARSVENEPVEFMPSSDPDQFLEPLVYPVPDTDDQWWELW